MKVTLETKGKLVKDDLLVFDGENLKPINKDMLTADLSKKIKNIEEEVKELKRTLLIVKAEIAYDRGEISEEEFNELCQ